MRPVSILILATIMLAFLSPPGITSVREGPALSTIQALDVCHHPAPGINPDLPHVYERCYKVAPLQVAVILDVLNIFSETPALGFQDERPPEFRP